MTQDYAQVHDSLGKATYRIRVEGPLGEDWSAYMGGMSIVNEWEEGQGAIATLHGELADQAALVEVINALNDLCFPLISVERLSGYSS